MLNSKTVFILGAGASKEVEMPLGKELALIISGKMDLRYTDKLRNGDWDLLDRVAENSGRHREELIRGAHKIRDGILLRNSVDDFLDLHKGDTNTSILAKAAIIKSILEKEATSMLAPRNEKSHLPAGIDFGLLDGTWFIRLIRMLGPGEAPENIFDDVAFIVFNYDRCLEHFLWYALVGLFSQSPGTNVREIFKRARIFHPYGTIGPIPQTEQPSSVPYGSQEGVDYVALTKRIRTYTEEANNPELQTMHEELNAAKTLVFLGFAYHQPNMTLLTPEAKLSSKKVYGTTKDISGADCEVIKRRLRAMVKGNEQGAMYLALDDGLADSDVTCSRFLDEIRLTLAT